MICLARGTAGVVICRCKVTVALRSTHGAVEQPQCSHEDGSCDTPANVEALIDSSTLWNLFAAESVPETLLGEMM